MPGGLTQQDWLCYCRLEPQPSLCCSADPRLCCSATGTAECDTCEHEGCRTIWCRILHIQQTTIWACRALCLIQHCGVLKGWMLEVLVWVIHHNHVTVHQQHIVPQPDGPAQEEGLQPCPTASTVHADTVVDWQTHKTYLLLSA